MSGKLQSPVPPVCLVSHSFLSVSSGEIYDILLRTPASFSRSMACQPGSRCLAYHPQWELSPILFSLHESSLTFPPSPLHLPSLFFPSFPLGRRLFFSTTPIPTRQPFQLVVHGPAYFFNHCFAFWSIYPSDFKTIQSFPLSSSTPRCHSIFSRPLVYP